MSGISDSSATSIPEAEQKARTQRRAILSRLPRLEFIILFGGLVAIAFGKLTRLGAAKDSNLLVTSLVVLAQDIAVCMLIAACIYLTYALRPSRSFARIALLVSLVVGAWSMANMAWLRMVFVQIHADVVRDFLAHPTELMPIVTNRMANKAGFTVVLALIVIPVVACMAYFLWRPRPIAMPRRRLLRRGIIGLAIAVAFVALSHMSGPLIEAVPSRATLATSCHWLALESLLGIDDSWQDGAERVDRIPRAGERVLPRADTAKNRPHVVLLILESAAYWATSFGEQPPEQTPTLTALAQEGILFDQTRGIVPRTTQGQFAILTGCYPNLGGGFTEAVPVDEPYESLASVLAREGYKSRFSQMCRGRFDCVPALASNLGFDSFWAREDLGDPSAALGYLAGDDMRMIEPAFDWFDQQTDPCLLVFMTSISHDPFDLPEWYGPTPDGEKEAFLATVRFTDGVVHEIVKALDERTRPEDVLLCVIADHGDGLGRNGIQFRPGDPYEGTLRIPWIIRWPGKVHAANVFSNPCSVLDVTPTLLSLLGYDVSQAGFDGIDAFTTCKPERCVPFFGWYASHAAGFVCGTEKTIYWPELNKAYRYDLLSDPLERSPKLLDAVEASRIRGQLQSLRQDHVIRFPPKRYRHLTLYDRWLTSSLGDMAWCYHLGD